MQTLILTEGQLSNLVHSVHLARDRYRENIAYLAKTVAPAPDQRLIDQFERQIEDCDELIKIFDEAS